MGHVENLKPVEAKPPEEQNSKLDLRRGKPKLFVEFIKKNGESKSIPYHFIEEIDSVAPYYRTIAITFDMSRKFQVVLHAAEGGTLRALHKRLCAGLVGEVIEKDGLQVKASAASFDQDGDEFAVARLDIAPVKKA